MKIPLRPGVAARLVAFCFLALAGCATARVSAERRADGTEHLRCRMALPACLVEAERLCQGRHYFVLRAVDEHDYRGGSQFRTDTRTSEAIVRCGPAMAWPLGVDPTALPAETAAPGAAPMAPTRAPAPSAPPRACVPGSTQGCVGPGACRGGQSCLADATGFGPCDCGAGPAPAQPPQ